MEIEESEANGNFISLDNLLEILGNPTRRLILSKLAKVPHSTSELANELGISRQAVHSQLKILLSYNIIEEIDLEKPGGKYCIKSNLSVRIDISPHYYNIKYSTEEIKGDNEIIQLKDTDFSTDYQRIKLPNKKIRFLGEKIKEIEDSVRNLEIERSELLQNKQCFLGELKNIMERQYKEKLLESIKERRKKDKLIKESLNLGEEIFFTLFFNPEKYFRKTSVSLLDRLLDDIFSSDMDIDLRARNRVSIEPLLKDLSKIMDFLHEEEDDWFFDL